MEVDRPLSSIAGDRWSRRSRLTGLRDRPNGIKAVPRQDTLFDIPRELVRVFDKDLQADGIPKVDDRGRTLDRHGLLHGLGSLPSAGGVAPRTDQAAMRHSSIDLTMNVKTRPKVALEAVPDQPREQLRTGTDDPVPKSLPAPMVAPNPDNQS